MTALVAAEWRKVTSTKVWWAMLLLGVLLTWLSTLPLLFISSITGGAETSVTELPQDEMVRLLWSTMGSATVVALILGVLSFTGEYRHETITDTFLTEPRRIRVVLSKAVVQVVLGVILALVTCAAAGIVLLAVGPSRGFPPAPVDYVLQVAAGVALCYALYAVLGMAFGALMTNQVLAIVLALLWVMVIEGIVITVRPEVGKWLPGGAASGVLQAPTAEGGDFLPIWLAALVLVGYAVVLAALAVATTLRRDIT